MTVNIHQDNTHCLIHAGTSLEIEQSRVTYSPKIHVFQGDDILTSVFLPIADKFYMEVKPSTL